MGVVVAIFGLLHFFIFIFSIFLFTVFFKKENYGRSELVTYLSIIMFVGMLGFFCANQITFASDDQSIMMTIGYTIVPITQASFAFFSYTVLYIINSKTKKNIRYAPILLGTITSAPVSVLMSTVLSQAYWNFLGKNIYG
ncbi:MAG: hypothetical protein ACJAS4_003035 [Bacteriovoracaceae bacterium]